MYLSELLHIIFSLAFGFSGFLGNSLLFYLILQMDMTRFRAYSLLLLCHVSFQITSSLANFLTVTSMLQVDNAQILVFHGPCINQPNSCVIIHFIGFYSTGSTNFTFFLSIFYRLYVVRRSAISVKTMAMLIIMIVPMVALGVVNLPSGLEESQLRYILKGARPEILELTVQLYGTDVHPLGNLSLVVVLIGVMFVAMLIGTNMARKWIIHRVAVNSQLSEASAAIHRGFINALACEGYLIIFSFHSLIAAVLISEGVVQSVFLESTVFLAHSIQFALTPFFVISFVNPLNRRFHVMLAGGNSTT